MPVREPVPRIPLRTAHALEAENVSMITDITAVTVVSHGALRLTFADGVSAELDVLDRMRGAVFADAHTLERRSDARSSGTSVVP